MGISGMNWENDLDCGLEEDFNKQMMETNFFRLRILALIIAVFEPILFFVSYVGILVTTRLTRFNMIALFSMALVVLICTYYIQIHDLLWYKHILSQIVINVIALFAILSTYTRFSTGNTDISLFLTMVFAMSITVISKPLVATLRYSGAYVILILLFHYNLDIYINPTIYINSTIFIILSIVCTRIIYIEQHRAFKEKKETMRINTVLQKLSQTDQLTGLNNRREIDNALELSITEAQRNGTPLSVIIMDVDDFKVINDTHGHLVGDQVLISLTDLLLGYIREQDIIGRWGGEEFVVICRATGIEEVKHVAERLRKAVSETCFVNGIEFTVSMGIGCLCEGQGSVDVLKTADQALYSAKSGGKNMVVVSQGLPVQ